MTVEELYDMTPRQFNNKVSGFMNKVKSSNQDSWERSRWMVWMIIQTQPIKSPPKKPQDLVRFPWEKSVYTAEDKKRVLKLAKKLKHI